MLEGWGRFVHRRRCAVLGVSLALLTLSAILLVQGGDLSNPDTIPSTESGRASQLLSDELPRPTGPPAGASFALVFRSDTLAVTDGASISRGAIANRQPKPFSSANRRADQRSRIVDPKGEAHLVPFGHRDANTVRALAARYRA